MLLFTAITVHSWGNAREIAKHLDGVFDIFFFLP